MGDRLGTKFLQPISLDRLEEQRLPSLEQPSFTIN